MPDLDSIAREIVTPRVDTFGMMPEEEQEMVSEIIAALRRVERETREWQTIETAPKDGTVVLLWVPSISPSTIQGQWSEDKGDGWDSSEWVDVWNNEPIENQDGRAEPTHWMPLPAPPAIRMGEKP